MKFLVVLTSVAAFLVKSTNGLYLVKKQEPAPVTSSGIEWIGDGGSREFGNGLLRRAPVENLAPQPAPGPAIVPLIIMRNGGIYTATIAVVGEKQRRINFQVSTSLGDTVVHSSKTLFVNPDGKDPDLHNAKTWCQTILSPGCDFWGTVDNAEPYDPSGQSSDQFKFYVNSDHLALADLYTDPFIIGRKVIPDVPFGIALISNLDTNFLGLGFTGNEAPPNNYPNLPQAMKNRKLTRINAYSLWLNEKSERNGEIIFGGYNRAKHTGNFAHLQVRTINGKFTESFVPAKGVSFEKGEKTLQALSLDAVILDLGAQISLLPRDFAEAFAKAVGATKSEDDFIIDCMLSDEVKSMYMIVDFDSVKIKLVAEDLVLPSSVAGAPPGKCFWGVFPTNDRPVLGNNFLRRAYVVFDLDHKVISIAQTAYTGASHVYEIPEGGLRALGDLLGSGDPDPVLERIAGNTESGDETASGSNTMPENANNEASLGASNSPNSVQNTPDGGINLASNAALTEPFSVGNIQGTQDQVNSDGSGGQTPYSFRPAANTFLGTSGAGTQQDSPATLMASNDASIFNPGEPEQFSAKLQSLSPGTGQSAENGVTTQQQQQTGEYFPTAASTQAHGTNQDSFTMMANNDGSNEKLGFNTASNLFPTPGTGEQPTADITTNSKQAFFPAAAGTSLLSNSNQGLNMDLASSLVPGGGGGEGAENLFLDTNAA
ncbi:hypothetical protein MMC22_006011 [Lobaria immixta]|nr:hypothetical protein [Lobaria immixta]